MEEIEKEVEIKKPRKSLLIGIIIIAIVVIFIVLSFILTSTDAGKKVLSDLKAEQEKQATEKGELGTISPTASSEGGEETTSDKKTPTSAGGGGGGGSGETTVTSTAEEETAYETGRLEVVNRVESYSGASYAIVHWQEGSEGIDDYDGRYEVIFDPSGISSKIVSTIESTELFADSRPVDSTSPVYLELSIVSESGNLITLSSSNQLELSFPLGPEYDFGDKEITLNVNGIDYDVRQLISDGNGIGTITLPDLDGTYNSGEVYETATIIFS